MPRLLKIDQLSRLPSRKSRLPLMKWLLRPRLMLKLVLKKVRDSLSNFWRKSWLSWLSWRMTWLDTISLMISSMMSWSLLLEKPLKTLSQPFKSTLVISLANLSPMNMLNICLWLISWKLPNISRISSTNSKLRLHLVKLRQTLLISWTTWNLLLMPRLLKIDQLSRLPSRKSRLPLMKWLLRPRLMLKLVLKKVRDSLSNFWRKSWLSWLSWRMTWLDTISLMISSMMSWSLLLEKPLKTLSQQSKNILVISLASLSPMNLLSTCLSLMSWKLPNILRISLTCSKPRLYLVRSRETLRTFWKSC